MKDETELEGLLRWKALAERHYAQLTHAEYQIKTLRDELSLQSEALKEAEKALEWVDTDMCFKAPEQHREAMEEWHYRLKSALAKIQELKKIDT